MTCKHKADTTGRKPLFGCPDTWWHMQPPERTVEGNSTFVGTIIQHYLKAARCCNNELMAFLVCVSPTIFSTRDVVRIEHTVDREWNMNIL